MIPYGKHFLDDDDINSVVDVLKNGWLTQGPLVEDFENSISTYVGAKYAVAVSSGTAALHLAMIAAGIKTGDSVITSPITFVATSNSIIYADAKPVFSDIDPLTINISPDSTRIAIKNNPGTKAIIPVHFAGLPCDMSSLKSIAEDANAVVIEDAAHALGAKYPDGTYVGNCVNSLMTIFSFHPVKAIAAGEGGMITTNNENIYRKLLRLRSHGINKLDDPFQLPKQAGENGITDPWYYEMQELGYNYRITDIQCALGLSQFKKINNFIERRRQLAKRYDAAFSDLSICKQAQYSGRESSAHHLYVLRINFEKLGKSRAALILELKSKGIASQVHYIPVPAHPFYRRMGFLPEDYPNAQNYYEEALSIPLYFGLSDDEQEYVINTIKELLS